MRDALRAEVLRRLRAAAEDPVREVTPRSAALPVSRYLDPAELDRERAVLFRRRPVIVAHASELVGDGDFVTEDVAGVPLLVVRDGEAVRVFVNACRHRGARLRDEARGSCGKLLTCPYHAWSYRLDGSLMKVPREEVFGAIDRASLGLVPVPSEVRHGFVWARLEGDAPLDVAAFLGPELDDDLSAFGLAEHRAGERRVHDTGANWKLVMDAFAEGYHLKSLHARSLARFFLDVAILDDLSPHVRQVGARKSLLEAPPDDLSGFREHTTVFYDLFPNTVLVFHPLWISAMTLWPLAVDRVRVVHRMLAREIADDALRAKLEKSFALIDGQVFEAEDLAIAESIQSTLASGANRRVLLGGLEEGMRLFHAARDAALAEG